MGKPVTSDQLRFRAFIWTLIALAAMFAMACFLAWLGKSVEAIGIGGVMTGLIALAGTLASGKQQSESLNATFASAIEQLGRSVPQQSSYQPSDMERSVRRGAEDGSRAGVNDALDGDGDGAGGAPTTTGTDRE